MKTVLSRFKYQITLVLIVAIIGLVNYRFGTYLTGWDNLQTELAPGLAIKRAVFAVWQEYQSFGLVGGMAHASDLLRAIGVWVLSFLLPQSLIRYIVHIGMLAVGGLGMFKLLDQKRTDRHPELSASGGSGSHNSEMSKPVRHDSGNLLHFLGALFYILNFATIQLFFLPFEPFSIFFASLPWLLWIFMKTLVKDNEDNKRSIFTKFFFINLLATPAFYVQTIFIVYILVLWVVALVYIARGGMLNLRFTLARTITAFAIIGAVNSFWIFPQLYFLSTGGSVTVSESKINQIATENVQLQNKARGTLSSFATFKSFYYDLKGSDQKALFEPWRKHLEKPIVHSASWSIFAVILLGITRKSFYRAYFLGIWLLCALALLSNTPGVAQIHELITRNNLIGQIFRAPFTKFAVPWALASSYFFMNGLIKLSSLKYNLSFRRNEVTEKSRINSIRDFSPAARNDEIPVRNDKLSALIFIVTFVLISIVSFPVFSGNLFSSHMRIKIPEDYFKTMEYFKQIPADKRIALMPQDSFWGWYHYLWGYVGSGFLWYGIQQPIVSPTFDVWSASSESYLWEMKHALASGDALKVIAVLNKYNIHFVLVDESILASSTHQKAFLADKIKELLDKSDLIQHEKTFGTIAIYKVKNAVPLVTQLKNVPRIGPIRSITNDDSAYATMGSYRSLENEKNEYYDFYFPFYDVFSQKKLNPATWTISENPQTFSLTTKLPLKLENYSLYSNTDTSLLQGSTQDNSLSVTFQKHTYVSVNATKAKPVQCQKLTVCVTYSLPEVAHDRAYILKVENEHISGQKLFFYVQNETNGNTIIEDRLTSNVAYYILPAGNRYDKGYTIGFQNDSYEGLTSENALINLQIYTIPLEQLKGLYFARTSTQGYTQKTDTNSKIIAYFQTYDTGWKAYVNGQELTQHVKVNNWANGWVVPATTNGSVRVVFWPQVLEYIGFGAIVCLGICIILSKSFPRSQSN